MPLFKRENKMIRCYYCQWKGYHQELKNYQCPECGSKRFDRIKDKKATKSKAVQRSLK